MQLVAYALSRCGELAPSGKARPPSWLGTTVWNRAYDLFYAAVGDGRTPKTHRTTLKNARDAFDAHHAKSPRIGWVDHKKGGVAYRADKGVRNVLDTWAGRSDTELRDAVLTILTTAPMDGDEMPEEANARTEGGQKVYLARKYERDAGLRADAVRIHRFTCLGCGFNFKEAYGPHGEGYIEVHHCMPFGEFGTRKTDPAKDLAVLCSNCHRMVHRRRNVCLSLDELRSKIATAKASA
ncbi:MAG: HNH endonuclease [Phenylobacterium sp.]